MSGFAVEPQVLTVSQLNQYLKSRFDADPYLGSVAVRGRDLQLQKISLRPSLLFPEGPQRGTQLCDVPLFRPASALSAGERYAGGGLRPGDGVPRDGRHQLYVDLMTADGVGDLHVAFEQLKQKLEAEGLFAPEHKSPIPTCPGKVALITSGAGAAVRDMIRILGAHWPMAKVLVLPVQVQGAGPREMIGALAYANRWQVADLIIIGRGGGSIEDLWAFNDEGLARAIYASELPVISAVGHEPDVTISDYGGGPPGRHPLQRSGAGGAGPE